MVGAGERLRRGLPGARERPILSPLTPERELVVQLPEPALRALLEPEEAGALAFLTAVAEQVVHHLRPRPPLDATGDEWAVVGRALELLREAAAGEVDAPARRLIAEPEMLAAFFQNVDLLYAEAAIQADAVGAVVMRALEVLSSAPPADSP